MADRVALYQRISEDELGLEKGIARQVEDGRALAVSRGWTVVAELSDNDISALKGAYRPDYEKLLNMARRGEIDRIVVFHTSRLWRNRKERAEGIEISAVKGTDLDLSSAFGRGMVGLMGEFDTMESEIKGERVARTALQRAQEGRANGAVAYGWQRVYDFDSQGRKIGFKDVECPEQAEIVREIVRRLLTGDTLIGITADLNERGVPAPGAGQNRKHRTNGQDESGSRWNKTSVKKIALRDANIAVRRHGQNKYPAAWPRLIEDEQHARLQLMFAARQADDRLTRPGQRNHLLTWGDIAICGVCGGWLRVAKRGNAKYGAKKETYCCDPKGCVGRNVEALDGYVRGLVLDRLGTKDAATVFESDGSVAVAVMERIEGLRAKQILAAEDYAANLIKREQLLKITESLGAQITDAQAELRRVQPAVDLSVLDGLIGDQAAEKWDALTVAQKRHVLEALHLRLEVHPVERRGPGFDAATIRFPQGGPFGV
jgi:DNA invertase Pin-like site-specific DNA recombinase